MPNEALLSTVRAYVASERKRLGITTLGTHVNPEPSGELFNEIDLLVDQQLLTTVEGHGGWLALEDPDVLSAVVGAIQRRSA